MVADVPRRQKLCKIVDLDNQTVELPDGSRVSSYVKDGKLMERLFDDCRTLYDGIRRGARVSNNGRMLGCRKMQSSGEAPYVWLNYQTVIDRSVDLAYGLAQLGAKPGQDTNIAVYSQNRPEWIISEHAIYNNSCLIVALYDTLGREARSYIINECNIQFIFCDNHKKATDLIASHKECPSLKCIIVFDEVDKSLTQAGLDAGMTVCGLEDVERKGRETAERSPLMIPKAEDLCTICYTSGTTGTPKGVLITHANVMAASAALEHFPNRRMGSNDTMISYLPLAHTYERLLHCIGYQVGASFGFFGGDIKKLMEDIKELQPTSIPLVPRVLHRFYDTVMAELKKSAVKRFIFNFALSYKNRLLQSGVIAQDTWADRFVFKKIHQQFGGRHYFLIVGSAPVDTEVLRFARALLGCVITQGYGSTECGGACVMTTEADPATNHIGIPLACNAAKLIDVPELGYFAKSGTGELLVRGANVFKGYYKNEAATKEVLDGEGWLHTGDIGRWTPQGTLQIIDRAKMIFKLQQGEYVAPERIEGIYERSQYVMQSFVYGESLKTCIIAIVVPEEKIVMEEAAANLDLTGVTLEELCRNERVKKMIMDDMIAVGSGAGLHNFEQVKDIYLTTEQFTIENDLLTPTLKSRRSNLNKYFAKELAQMYSKLK